MIILKNKISKKIISIILVLCIAFSLVPMSITSPSAAISLVTFEGWLTNQIYTKGLSTAGSILASIGKKSGNENFAEFTSFINTTFCGGSNTDTMIAELQNTCNEILDTTKRVESVVNDINSKISENKITASSKECDDAWENQVMGYITKHDESVYDFYNVYIAYRNYLNFASNQSVIPSGKTLKDYENDFIAQIVNFYIGKTNKSFATAKDIYTTDTIDICITGVINSILNTMDPQTTSVGMGKRFVDIAAQYAYYAYPYSCEQAKFVDSAIERQINTVTYLLMIYQDFLAHRAEYFEENGSTQEYKDIWQSCYEKHYTPLFDKFQTTCENLLNGDIYLRESGAYTTLEKYVREDSATVCFEQDKKVFTLKNTHLTTKNPYNPNIHSSNTFATTYMTFYKNASVSVKDRRLEFTPFYILNSNQLKDYQKFLKTFDCVVRDTHGPLPAWSFYDSHYLNCDYLSLKSGIFTDGTNTYVPMTNPNQLKDIINETYYTANNCTPASYFSQFTSYAVNNPLYLLLDGDTYTEDNYSSTEYTHFPVFNMSSSRAYSTSWDTEMLSSYYLQSDRNGDENKTNSMYTLILVPKDKEIKSKVDTKLIGEGNVTVSGLTDGKILSGENVKLDIQAPETHWISNIKIQYHNDISDPSRVTSEKVISKGFDSNKLTLDIPVPYSNITIVAETKKIPGALSVDSKGNYVVSSYDELCQMAEMVNSGYSKYAKASYVLTKDIYFQSGKEWTTPIGTEENPFIGNFNGQGHTLNNLLFNADSTAKDMGVFGVINGGTVDKLTIAINTLSVNNRHNTVGSICGVLKEGTISDCVVVGELHASADYVGGIAGACENSTIKNCIIEMYFAVNSAEVDGVCPQTTESTIKNCSSNFQVVQLN